VIRKRGGKEKPFSLIDKLYDSDKKRPACPVCGVEVVKPEGEVMYYCPNAACPAQVQQRLEHFASRGAMDIRGVGEKMSVILVNQGLVKDFADLYRLRERRDELIAIDRMAEKSADNILAAIEKSKKMPLPRLIYALGIRHVGSETAELLAEHFNSLDKLESASEEELASIPAVGPKIAGSVAAFFTSKENKELITKLEAAGVLPLPEARPREQPLAGQEFVITGHLGSLSRQEAESQIKVLGGTTRSDVSAKTTYLVVGADPGSKLARARALGIEQITEDKLIRLLEPTI
jgi:DNA ligase (NAD+)